MSLVDFILNLAALLLWFNWRAVHMDPLAGSSPSTLLGTLKPAERHRARGWPFLAGLLLLLVLRALVYWAIGSPAEWTPRLSLGLIVLAFPNEKWWAELAFSLLGFARVWLVAHFWLVVVCWVSGPGEEPGPIRRVLRLQLGHLAQWPWPLRLPALPLLAALLWLAGYWPLARLNVISPAGSMQHLVEQALLLGVWLVFSLKFILPPFLFLYMVANYVYLGGGPFWDFVSSVARGLLRPIRGLPMRIGRVDLAPVVGIALVLLLLDRLPSYLLGVLSARRLPFWPQ